MLGAKVSLVATWIFLLFWEDKQTWASPIIHKPRFFLENLHTRNGILKRNKTMRMVTWITSVGIPISTATRAVTRIVFLGTISSGSFFEVLRSQFVRTCGTFNDIHLEHVVVYYTRLLISFFFRCAATDYTSYCLLLFHFLWARKFMVLEAFYIQTEQTLLLLPKGEKMKTMRWEREIFVRNNFSFSRFRIKI